MTALAPATGRVVLLHGIWMRKLVMAWLAQRLRSAGYAVIVPSYASIRSPFTQHHALIDELLAGADGTVHFVGHSLGGLLALDYLRHRPGRFRATRVVCLGSPLLGSTLASRLAAMRLDRLGMGQARAILRNGLARWEGPQEVGVIAGEWSFGLSLILGRLPRPNDGTVAVIETRLPGIADHITVRANHTGLLFSKTAAELTLRFLREGRFAQTSRH